MWLTENQLSGSVDVYSNVNNLIMNFTLLQCNCCDSRNIYDCPLQLQDTEHCLPLLVSGLVHINSDTVFLIIIHWFNDSVSHHEALYNITQQSAIFYTKTKSHQALRWWMDWLLTSEYLLSLLNHCDEDNPPSSPTWIINKTLIILKIKTTDW